MINVPAEFHRCAPKSSILLAVLSDLPSLRSFLDAQQLEAVQVGVRLTQRIHIRPAERADLDAFLVLEGPPEAIEEARGLLAPSIEKAKKSREQDSADMQSLLFMGYRRQDAQRALLETCRGATTDVAAALKWLDENADPPQQQQMASEPEPAAEYEVGAFPGPLQDEWMGICTLAAFFSSSPFPPLRPSLIVRAAQTTRPSTSARRCLTKC